MAWEERYGAIWNPRLHSNETVVSERYLPDLDIVALVVRRVDGRLAASMLRKSSDPQWRLPFWGTSDGPALVETLADADSYFAAVMGSVSERVFRSVERELDDMLAIALPLLTALGLTHTDRSVRTYHYKESYLRWEAEFERQSQRQHLLTLQVRISLSYAEPVDSDALPKILLSRRVEIFRLGQVSSFDHRHEESYSLDAVRTEGIAVVVRRYLEGADALLDTTT
jgi:hypothetical protein